VMAMTATATPAVCGDIELQLRMSSCAFFKQSFNRANLRYKVLKKNKDCIDDIVTLLEQNFVV